MPDLSRSQLAVYAALAVAALLLGSRWIRSQDAAPDGANASAPAYSSYGSSSSSTTGSGTQSGATDGSGDTNSGSFETQPSELVVDVAGAVNDPGVYTLAPGARVIDAIKRAGGMGRQAERGTINLAAKLADGQQVVVPARAASATSGAASGSAPGSSADTDAPISLGTATVDQLDQIDGIGPVTAQDIIDFRDSHGGVSSVDDLDQVSGIGPATMEALRDRLQP